MRPPVNAVKIALLQINPLVGDLAGNARLIAEAACRAGRQGAGLAVTPELALVGYLPRDLLVQSRVRRTKLGSGADARPRSGGPSTRSRGAARAQSLRDWTAALQHGGAAARGSSRRAVSQVAAADLRRVRRGPLFRTVSRCTDPGARRPPARHQHLRGRVERSRLLAAPPLSPRPDRSARAGGRRRHRQPLGVAVLGSASTSLREKMLGSIARKHRVPIVYVNQFGGNDDLVFDGRSLGFNAAGAPIAPRPSVRRRRRDLRHLDASMASTSGPSRHERTRRRRRIRDLAARSFSVPPTTSASADSPMLSSGCRAVSTRR